MYHMSWVNCYIPTKILNLVLLLLYSTSLIHFGPEQVNVKMTTKLFLRLEVNYNIFYCRSNSPAMFPDTPESVLKPLFQTPLVQQKPLPAPEMRTYDPVTGKLIRRGPQASRPPSYLHSHGSSISAKGDLSSLRYFIWFVHFCLFGGVHTNVHQIQSLNIWYSNELKVVSELRICLTGLFLQILHNA